MPPGLVRLSVATNGINFFTSLSPLFPYFPEPYWPLGCAHDPFLCDQISNLKCILLFELFLSRVNSSLRGARLLTMGAVVLLA